MVSFPHHAFAPCYRSQAMLAWRGVRSFCNSSLSSHQQRIAHLIQLTHSFASHRPAFKTTAEALWEMAALAPSCSLSLRGRGSDFQPILSALSQHVAHPGFKVNSSPADIVRCLWGLARLRFVFAGSAQLGKVVSRLSAAALHQLPHLTPGQLSIAAWAVARSDTRTLSGAEETRPAAPLKSNTLLAMIPGYAIDRAAEFSPQDIANTLWALTTTGNVDMRCFEQFERELLSRGVEGLMPITLTTILWAYARTGTDWQILPVIANHLNECSLSDFQGKDLSLCVWALAKGKLANAELFDKLAIECTTRLSAYQLPDPSLVETEISDDQTPINQGGRQISSHVDLVHLAWGFAKSRQQSQAIDSLFTRVASVSILALPRMTPGEASVLVWSFATASLRALQLFDQLSSHTIDPNSHLHLSKFRGQALVNLLWAYARAGVRAQKMFVLAASRLAGVDKRPPTALLRELSTEGVAKITWVYGRVHKSLKDDALVQRLFASLESVAIPRMNRFRAEDLANILWGFRRAGCGSARLMANISMAIERRARTLPSWAIAEVVVLLMQSGAADSLTFAKLYSEVLRRGREKFSTQELEAMQTVFSQQGMDTWAIAEMRQGYRTRVMRSHQAVRQEPHMTK